MKLSIRCYCLLSLSMVCFLGRVSAEQVIFESNLDHKESVSSKWLKYQAGYSLDKNRSFDNQRDSGSIEVNITHASKVGLGGAFTFIPVKDASQNTFKVSTAIYVDSYNVGIIYSHYIHIHYKDGKSELMTKPLSGEQIKYNIGKWVEYDLVISPKIDKPVEKLQVWLLCWGANGRDFKGKVLFDNIKVLTGINRNEQNLPKVSIFHAVKRPNIDGLANDLCWKNGIDIAPFFTLQGLSLAGQQTVVRCAYDSDNLYLFAELREQGLDPVMQRLDKFSAVVEKKDGSVYADDCLEIFINPNITNKQYYHIVVNPKAAIYDASVLEGKYDKSWDSKALSAAKIGDKSWFVELAIPLKAFNIVKPLENSLWRVNFCRSEKPYSELSAWSPTKAGFHTPDKFGILEFGKKLDTDVRLVLGDILSSGEIGIKADYFGNNDSKISIETVVGEIDSVSGFVWKEQSIFNLTKESSKSLLKTSYASNQLGQGVRFNIKSNEDIIARSAWLGFPLETVFFNQFVYPSSQKVYTKPITEFYVSQGEYVHIPVVLSAPKGTSQATLELDVPVYLTLIDPAGEGKTAAKPTKYKLDDIDGNNCKKKKYTFIFDSNSLTEQGASQYVINSLFFNCDIIADKDKNQDEFINYNITYDADKKLSGKVPLFVLEPFVQRKPSKVRIHNWPSGEPCYYEYFHKLGENERLEIINSWLRNGFTSHDYRLQFPPLLKKYNLKDIPFSYSFPSYLESLCVHVPQLKAYMQKHPELGTARQNGEQLPNVLSYAHIYDPNSDFVRILKDYIGGLAKQFESLNWDHEVPVAMPQSAHFDAKNIELFRKSADIDNKTELNPSVIAEKYRDKWVDFRNRQIADLVKIMADAVKETNPDCKFAVYSGYESIHTKEVYGINWAYVAPNLDEVWCGYGRMPSLIEATQKAIGDKPLVAGEIIWMGDGTFYDLKRTEVNLFRFMTDTGNIMTWYDWIVDSRFYDAVSKVAATAADYGDFFAKINRGDSSVHLEGAKVEYAVLKNDKYGLLLFIFNYEDYVQKAVVKVSDKFEIASDYWNKKIITDNGDNFSISLPPCSVGIYRIGNQANFENLPEVPNIVRTNTVKNVNLPFLLWNIENAGEIVFTVQYSMDISFESSVKEITGIKNSYLKIEDELQRGTYYWRVKSVNFVNGNQSQYSDLSSFIAR